MSRSASSLVSYKRLLDDGHVLPFGADMALEAQVAVLHNNIDPATIEERWRALLARGRVQSNSWAHPQFRRIEATPMKIGVFSILPDAAADPAIVAKHAEDLGFASYWVPDHIILPLNYSTPYPGNPGNGPDPDYLWQMPDPLIALMRAATATTTLEVGTGVLLVPERHPLHLAKEIASLDAYSGGRFQFGIGAGWNKEESEILGGDFEHRWSQVKEAIAVMKVCWTEDAPEHHGRYYNFPSVRCYPKPAQRPHPPVYLGGIMFGDQWARRVFKRIVEWGDGWLPIIREVQQLIDGRDQLHALCAEACRDPASIRITVFGARKQWRKRREVEVLAAAGAEQVTIWLLGRASDDMRRELDALAQELLAN